MAPGASRPAPRPSACKRSRTCLGLLALAAAAANIRSLSFVQAPPSSSASSDAASRRRLLTSTFGGLVTALGIEASAPQATLAEPGDIGEIKKAERRRIAYPPIDKRDKKRCRWKSSAMGQANAARDKLFDVRECKMSGSSAAEKDIAGVLMDNGDFSNVDFTGATLSKASAQDANLEGAIFKNAIVDRVTFTGANLKGAVFQNAVLAGATFEEANLENSDFTDASLETYAVKPLCTNPTMKGTNPTTGQDTYLSAGCDNLSIFR